jgi:hypothetical protein
MMNEKIKELLEQSGFRYITDDGIGWAGNYNSSLPKFAELIVDDVCDDMLSLEPMYPANIVALKIRQKYNVGAKENLGSLDQYDDPSWQGKQ